MEPFQKRPTRYKEPSEEASMLEGANHHVNETSGLTGASEVAKRISKPIFGLVSPAKSEQALGKTDQIKRSILDINRAKRQLFGDDVPTKFLSSFRRSNADNP